LLDHGHIVANAGNDLTGTAFGKKSQRQALHALKDLQAQIGHDPLANAGNQKGVDDRKYACKTNRPTKAREMIFNSERSWSEKTVSTSQRTATGNDKLIKLEITSKPAAIPRGRQ